MFLFFVCRQERERERIKKKNKNKKERYILLNSGVEKVIYKRRNNKKLGLHAKAEVKTKTKPKKNLKSKIILYICFKKLRINRCWCCCLSLRGDGSCKQATTKNKLRWQLNYQHNHHYHQVHSITLPTTTTEKTTKEVKR